MRTWRKIVSLVGVSACAALLGAACTATVDDSADTAASVETAEDAVTGDTPVDPTIGRPGEDRWGGWWWRCERRCHERFEWCRRSGRPVWECQRQENWCRQRCRVWSSGPGGHTTAP